MSVIVWFRQDLRLEDNPAFFAAVKNGDIVPVYILDDRPNRKIGGASRWWLHNSLQQLSDKLGGMVLARGRAIDVLTQLAKECRADAVYWNRCYEPEAIARDKEIKTHFKELGFEAKSFNGSLLAEPWDMQNKQGGSFKVYSPFWKSLQTRDIASPLGSPAFQLHDDLPKRDALEDWELLPTRPNWAEVWDELWRPGETGAKERLDAFLANGLEGYGELRNRPDRENISRLSPHLHFGEISPRQIWARVAFVKDEKPSLAKDGQKFLSEIAWREFSYHLLYHFPELPEKNWRPHFDAYPWVEDSNFLKAWQRGKTGYPIVDAGMRELWQTGYMHNRVRMIVASFLIKHLRIDWREGEAWFWDTLLDADLANNAASWQWVAGSGADASPYFRIFNPITQGQKFDPNGDYVRRWCPELSSLDTQFIHAPFEAPEGLLKMAGIDLGVTYPEPLVDHMAARQLALKGYEAVKAASLEQAQ